MQLSMKLSIPNDELYLSMQLSIPNARDTINAVHSSDAKYVVLFCRYYDVYFQKLVCPVKHFQQLQLSCLRVETLDRN